MSKILLLAALATCAQLACAAPVVPEGTRMRVLDPSLGPDWIEGRLKTAKDGCVLVWFDHPMKDYKAASVAGQRKVEMRKGDAWVAAPVQEINARQPAACRRGGDND